MNISPTRERRFGFWVAMALGIGGMLGGSIFVLFAFAVEIGQGGTPLAFALAGFVALLTSYSYVRLTLTYPSEGGTIEFLNRAFGRGLFSGVVNVFLWLSYIVILALYTYAFSSYSLWRIPITLQPVFRPLVSTGIIIVLTGINILSVRMMGKAQLALIAILLLLLLPFLVIGLLGIPQYGAQFFVGISPFSVIAGGMIIFVSFEGFELIANTALEVDDPETTLPRAYYLTVLAVTVLYILLSIVAIGNVPFFELINAHDYALAIAAQAVLGVGGFLLIVIAALLSTCSAMNATLYGTAKTGTILARDQQLPQFFLVKVKDSPLNAFLIIALITIIITNIFDLYAISIMGSVGFLFIFALINIANLRLAKQTRCYRLIPFLGFLFCGFAIIVVLWFTLFTRPLEVVGILSLGLAALLLQFLYRRTIQRT